MDHKYKEPQQLKLKQLKDLAPTDYYDVSCPKCQGNIAGSGININDKIAKCEDCGVVFSFQEAISHLTKTQSIKQELIRPEGVDLFYLKDELDITLQQPYSGLEMTWGFTAISFALIFTAAFVLEPALLPMVGALTAWLLSIYPIYSWTTHAKNKVYITINERLLNIDWRPKKGNKSKSFDIQDIDQVYVRANASMGYHDLYLIMNGVEGQKHVRLMHGFYNLSKARYVEQEIEKYLGIKDREVLEEVKV